MLTRFCCFRKHLQWYLGLSLTSCCLSLLIFCSLHPVGAGVMLCPPLLQEAGAVPSTELECKPSSTFSSPHLPSWKVNPSFCASHLQAGGSCCLGLALCCAAVGARGAAASLGGSVVCRDGWFAVAAEHQVWQLDRLPGHLSLPQSSAGVPAGFLKCKLQLQCETHPFALLFFSSHLPV